jgi:hypothetical protein
MKSKLQTLVIILTAALFFTACEKEESIENFDTISGVLTAGENVSSDDLNGLKVYLGRFHDSVDFSSITLETTAIDSVAATTLSADGIFTFSNLTVGNYGLVLEEGFIITGDTALTLQFNALQQQTIEQTIDRIPLQNMQVQTLDESTTPKITLKRDNLSSTYRIKTLKCYNDSKLKKSYDVPEFSNNSINDWSLNTIILSGNVTFELVICKLDNVGNETNTFTSAKIKYYKSGVDNTPKEWFGNPIDIKWEVIKRKKYYAWGLLYKTIDIGYYTISDH